MKIDCDSCPGRPMACGGCMMNVLVQTEISRYPAETSGIPSVAEQRADLLVAIANFREAMLVTPAEARAATRRIKPRQDGSGGRLLSVVQAG